MWAAIAYRRTQALALLALSALITACAAFAPLYERALEQSLLRDGLTRLSPSDTAISAVGVSTRDYKPVPRQVRAVFPPVLGSVYDGGSDLWSGRLRFTGVARTQSTITVVGPQDTCRALQLSEGGCPSRPFEVAVSAAEARVQGWKVGQQLTALEDLPGVADPPPFPQPFVVTGLFQQLEDPGHWMGTSLEGRAGQAAMDQASTPLMDGWVTPESTFSSGWSAARVTVTWLLNRDALTLDGLEAVPPAIEGMRSAGFTATPSVSVRSEAPDLVAGVVEGQRQARTIVPLLMGQLAILAVVVLGLVAAAAVEQRRPELALARLRGRGPGGAARMVMLELGTIVAAGVPVGFLVALGMNEVARRWWLAPGVPFELPSATFVAALIALVAALLAVAVVARPTLREPITTLLRRVPPRRRGWAVGVTDAVVVALAAAGVVTLVNGNLSGPLALATPTLLALALGLVLAHVLIPVADALARRLTARGRLVGGLTAVQVARRPAVRRIMAIITVATALTVFATDAVVVGARNRDDRARAETGAEAVLTTNAADVGRLVAAVRSADPSGTIATPVVLVRQGNAASLATQAVVPSQFSRIAELPRDPGAFDWSVLQRTPPPDVVLTGRALSVTLSDLTLQVGPGSAGTVNPVPPRLIAYLAPLGSSVITLSVGTIPLGSPGPVTLTTPASCANGCRLAGLGIGLGPGFQGVLRGGMTIGSLTVDGAPPAAVGDASQWLPSGDPNGGQQQAYATAVPAGDRTRIGLQLQTQRDDVRISTASTSARIPALVVGPLPGGSVGNDFQAAGLDGITTDMVRAGAVPYAPGGATSVALVSLDGLAQRATQVSALGLAQVWLSDPARVGSVRTALAESGIEVTGVELRTDRQDLFDSSASAWGLRLALVVGIMALLIAGMVLLLVAVTSWRVRARDYAALRMAGVSGAALRRVGVLEQGAVVLVSVAAGTVCGILGAQLAMPIIPFFTVPSTLLRVDTTPATGWVALAAGSALVVLLAVGTVVGVRLAGRASLSRVRDQL